MRATLFDFNGVLIDDEKVHFAAFRDVIRPHGLDLTEALYTEKYLGYDDAGAFRHMLLDAGKPASAADIAKLIEEKKHLYMDRIATELVIFDGAADLVRRRQERGPVGIVSGALRHEIEHALGVMGVTVSFIIAAEDAKECKPDPEGYLLGLRALGVDPGDAASRHGIVVLEDSTAGIIAAKKANLRCAGVTTSYPRDRLLQAGADVVVDRLSDLDDALFEGT